MKYLFKLFCAIFFLFSIVTTVQAETDGFGLYNQGWTQVDAKQYKIAKQTFDKSYSLLPDDQKWLALDGQAWVSYYEGNNAAAAKQFSEIVQKYPNAYLSYKGLGYTQLKQKSWKAAFKNLTEAFTQNPSQLATDYLYAAHAFIAAKQYPDAEKILTQAQTAYPTSGDVKFYLAKALWLQGKKDQAYPLLLEASYNSPTSVSTVFNTLQGLDASKIKMALMNMGWGLYVDGYYEAALYRFNQYLKLDATDLNALRGKAFCLVQLGQYHEAITLLTQIIQDKDQALLQPVQTTLYTPDKTAVPIYVNSTVMLGWAQYYLGNYDQAITTFKGELEQYPLSVNARLGLAYTLKAQGKISESDEEVKTINQQVQGYAVNIPTTPIATSQENLLIYNYFVR